MTEMKEDVKEEIIKIDQQLSKDDLQFQQLLTTNFATLAKLIRRDLNENKLTETFGKDIVFIREDLGKVIDTKKSFFHQWWLQVISFFYGLCVFVVWLWLRRKRFIEDNRDVLYRLKAPQRASEALEILNSQEITDKEIATQIRHIIEDLFVALFKLP